MCDPPFVELDLSRQTERHLDSAPFDLHCLEEPTVEDTRRRLRDPDLVATFVALEGLLSVLARGGEQLLDRTIEVAGLLSFFPVIVLDPRSVLVLDDHCRGLACRGRAGRGGGDDRHRTTDSRDGVRSHRRTSFLSARSAAGPERHTPVRSW